MYLNCHRHPWIGVEFFSAQWISVILLLLGIASCYISNFSKDIESYGERGKKHTQQFNQMKNLYLRVKAKTGDDIEEEMKEYENIEMAFNNDSQPKQLFLVADWMAHYKLFFTKDISWMDEQLHFNWFRDKTPQSLKMCTIFLVICIVLYYCYAVPPNKGIYKFFY
ncbi:MAG: SLATT domain-containing protein [Prevotella sp.]|nr:SLATT domain-containing protein [Prevotella sp.]